MIGNYLPSSVHSPKAGTNGEALSGETHDGPRAPFPSRSDPQEVLNLRSLRSITCNQPPSFLAESPRKLLPDQQWELVGLSRKALWRVSPIFKARCIGDLFHHLLLELRTAVTLPEKQSLSLKKSHHNRFSDRFKDKILLKSLSIYSGKHWKPLPKTARIPKQNPPNERAQTILCEQICRREFHLLKVGELGGTIPLLQHDHTNDDTKQMRFTLQRNPRPLYFSQPPSLGLRNVSLPQKPLRSSKTAKDFPKDTPNIKRSASFFPLAPFPLPFSLPQWRKCNRSLKEFWQLRVRGPDLCLSCFTSRRQRNKNIKPTKKIQ